MTPCRWLAYSSVRASHAARISSTWKWSVAHMTPLPGAPSCRIFSIGSHHAFDLFRSDGRHLLPPDYLEVIIIFWASSRSSRQVFIRCLSRSNPGACFNPEGQLQNTYRDTSGWRAFTCYCPVKQTCMFSLYQPTLCHLSLTRMLLLIPNKMLPLPV